MNKQDRDELRRLCERHEKAGVVDREMIHREIAERWPGVVPLLLDALDEAERNWAAMLAGLADHDGKVRVF